MIIDNIKNCEKYYSLHPSFAAAFEQLKKMTAESEPGRYTVDGDSVFVNMAAYTTKTHDACKYENHKKYVDIQYVLSGAERIDLIDADKLTVTEDKYADGDIAFFALSPAQTSVTLQAGDFVLIFPDEAHSPCMADNNVPSAVAKAVAKVRL
ncbi:MAG: YhcH/YjgK/YiaL family protein [Clostridia bacterium]|nr:YhcH/YjgK/YiaL family protein [Clostridia bacterium]